MSGLTLTIEHLIGERAKYRITNTEGQIIKRAEQRIHRTTVDVPPPKPEKARRKGGKHAGTGP